MGLHVHLNIWYNSRMPAPIVAKEEVLRRLLCAFREFGYEGATLDRISKATGLGKASLYHYFPRGKEEMAAAVLGVTSQWFKDNIIAALESPDLSADRKIKAMIGHLLDYYDHGRDACLVEILLHGDVAGSFQGEIKKGFDLWSRALVAVLVAAGIPKGRARQNVEDMFVKIQGALIVAKAQKRIEIFERTVRQIPIGLFGKD